MLGPSYTHTRKPAHTHTHTHTHNTHTHTQHSDTLKSTVYVSNIQHNINDTELEELFKQVMYI